ncbi:GGDEF domain-containing protein [Halomonas campisalis]|uniref:diguanylate cyclase n=1 Tax=Billgrantia campisalis TaxID=74661 RepID=A0ABS9P6L5_9GAMM|nr:biofilm regulation diguanylate cyclase SiaD [Halomonas campisalis]MCG6657415.1 GGDEF domain-containing protein [Halomonas campisalis]MDR5863240.1 biofilm regulation diguanylate cyclase SiaD [Halomonas campisalis]
MNGTDERLLEEIAELLADPAHRDHPLHAALSQLLARHREQSRRLDRLIGIADGFQHTAQQDLHATRHELERQLHRQRKLSRIADRYQLLLSERNEALRNESHHDPLTGLANRRLLHEHLERLIGTSERYQRPFTLAMLDIDHFKRINDRFGHDVGDRALTQLADTLQSTLRTSDHCGRWGGEEFLVILPETTLEQAEPLMSRLCNRMRHLDIRQDGVRIRITASVGVAQHRPPEDYERTLQRADEALLQAKRQGRNRWLAAG